MKIGIYFNEQQVARDVAEELVKKVSCAGGDAFLYTDLAEIKGADRLIVLGGDGTILRAARACSRHQIPLVGVNYGHIGFLTEFERGEEEKAIALALDDRCTVLHRTMLEVELNGTKMDCLNELVLHHAVTDQGGNRISKIAVKIDGSAAGEFVADGLIVATPTGSTAYSLSAGGSIMTPDCATFLLTPVCAFSLRSRPVAYSDKSVLEFSVLESTPFMLYGDGMFFGKACAGEKITVRKSKRYASFLSMDKGGFFRRLTEKIN